LAMWFDLAIAAAIAVPTALIVIVAVSRALAKSDAREVEVLLERVRCPHCHGKLSWEGGVWGVDDGDPREPAGGYILVCKKDKAEYRVTMEGKLLTDDIGQSK